MDPRSPAFWRAYLQAETAGSAEEASFELPWGDGAVLRLEADELGKTLLLREQEGRTSPLGWWDDARWHPHALRWEELEILTTAWAQTPAPGLPGAPVPLLLLAPFAGFGGGDAAQRERARGAVQGALATLGVPPAEAEEVTGRALLPVSEKDYRWSRDEELGWVFGGGYPCYSLRNRDHADGAEGRFPFEAFKRRFPEQA